jgi:hypothetical protein
MAELNRDNWPGICRGFCAVRIGRPSEKVFHDLEKANVSTLWIEPGRAAKKFNAMTGEWVALKPQEGEFCRIIVPKGDNITNVIKEIMKLEPTDFKKLPKGFKLDWNFHVWLRQVGRLIRKLYSWFDLVVLDAILVTGLIGWQIRGYIKRYKTKTDLEAKKEIQTSVAQEGAIEKVKAD